MKTKTLLTRITFSLLAVLLFFACEKEGAVSNPEAFETALQEQVISRSTDEIPEVTNAEPIDPAGFPVLQAYLDSDDYLNYTATNGLTAVEYTLVYTSIDYSFYMVQFATDSDITTNLALYPSGDQLLPVILDVVDINDNQQEVTFSLFSSGEAFGSILVDMGGNGTGGMVFRKTCNQSSSSFEKCLTCAGQELNTGWGTIACWMCGGCCAGAAIIHCAMGDYPSDDTD